MGVTRVACGGRSAGSSGTLVRMATKKRTSRRGRSSRRSRGDARGLYKFAVEVDEYSMGADYMKKVGEVRLSLGANDADVEQALSRVGVYAPRGADRLVWSKSGSSSGRPDAVIRKSDGQPIVFLWRLP